MGIKPGTIKGDDAGFGIEGHRDGRPIGGNTIIEGWGGLTGIGVDWVV